MKIIKLMILGLVTVLSMGGCEAMHSSGKGLFHRARNRRQGRNKRRDRVVNNNNASKKQDTLKKQIKTDAEIARILQNEEEYEALLALNSQLIDNNSDKEEKEASEETEAAECGICMAADESDLMITPCCRNSEICTPCWYGSLEATGSTCPFCRAVINNN